MTKHLHKKFSTEEVKILFQKYLNEKVELVYILKILGIKRRRFFRLLKEYKKSPDRFSIQHKRTILTRKISKDVEINIINELKKEKELIGDKEIPLTFYNYSYIKDLISQKYKQEVSLPTIITRAKREGFYIPKQKRKLHDREVLTNYIGELIQHDSSYHKFSPYADKKWCLITSLAEVRIWYKDILCDFYHVKNSDLNLVHF